VGLEFLDSAPSFADTVVQDTEAVDSTDVPSATNVCSNMIAVSHVAQRDDSGGVKLLISSVFVERAGSTRLTRLLNAWRMADSQARLFCLWISLPLFALRDNRGRALFLAWAGASQYPGSVRYTESGLSNHGP